MSCDDVEHGGPAERLEHPPLAVAADERPARPTLARHRGARGLLLRQRGARVRVRVLGSRRRRPLAAGRGRDRRPLPRWTALLAGGADRRPAGQQLLHAPLGSALGRAAGNMLEVLIATLLLRASRGRAAASKRSTVWRRMLFASRSARDGAARDGRTRCRCGLGGVIKPGGDPRDLADLVARRLRGRPGGRAGSRSRGFHRTASARGSGGGGSRPRCCWRSWWR